MNKTHKLFIISLSTFGLTQCKVIERVTNVVSDAPHITEVTTAPQYFQGKRPIGNLNQIAAKVNERIVTKNEYNFIISPIIQQLNAQFPRKNSQYYSELSKSKKKTFDELINRELILSEFTDIGGDIPEREIDREINNRINTLYNGSRSAFVSDLKKNGLSQSKYRDLVKRNVIVGVMKSQHLTTYAPPTTSELNKEYAKFKDKIRDVSKDKASFKKIWIPLNSDELGGTTEDQLKLAENLAKQIRQGADFSSLAKEHSIDAFAEQGGQWPLTARLDFPTYFAPIIFDAPIGKTIGPLKDEHGFHIIKVTKKVKGPSPSMSELRPHLERRVKANKSSERFNRWVERLRKNATIKKFL